MHLTPSLCQTSFPLLCHSGSGGEDNLLQPQQWRLLLPVMPSLLTSELPRLPPHLHLPLPPRPLTSPHPCPSGLTGEELGLTPNLPLLHHRPLLLHHLLPHHLPRPFLHPTL